MKIRAVVQEVILANRFVGMRIEGGKVEGKGTWDVPRSRFVAVGNRGRGSVERISGGSRYKSNRISRAVVCCRLKFSLIHSLLVVPKQIFIIGSIEDLKESTAWVALPFVEVMIVKVSKSKFIIHFFL